MTSTLAQMTDPLVTPTLTIHDVYRRVGLAPIPQESLDSARRQIRDHEELLADQQVMAAIEARNAELLRAFRRRA